MSLKLYMFPFSTTSRPVRLFIAEKKLPVSEHAIDLMSGEHLGPEYAAINPNKAVPVLEDGEFRMTESSAILKYLAALFEAPEYPRDLKERARVDSAMDWFNTGFYRYFGYGLIYPQVFPHQKRPSDEQQAGTIAWGRDKAKAWLSVLDHDMLGTSDYVANNRLSIADYFGVCFLTLGEWTGCRWNGYANIERWVGTVKKLGSWAQVNEPHDGFAGALAKQSFETL
ncbi:MAG TPA: glutathione S-transferase family protein [Polyangiaceae bacterium]|nr:glutathione S-transferase family protein [Polyangiaceae bacterium]